jgi:hypothetical protein
MVNRSVTWAEWDEALLALELQEIQVANPQNHQASESRRLLIT